MRTTLFRPEALESQRTRRLGEVSLAQPLPVSLLTALAAAMAIALAAFGWFAQTTRQARVSGMLVAAQGLVKVHAPQPGTIAERRVGEGDRVKRGDVLFVLSADPSSLVERETEAAAIERAGERRSSLLGDVARQSALDEIARRDLTARSRAIADELAQMERAIATQHERLANSRSAVERHAELVRRQFVSEAALGQQRELLLEQTARLQALERSRSALRREAASLDAEAQAQPARAAAARAALMREVSTVEQQLAERESRRGLVVGAPADGVVTAVRGERGQLASPAVPLLTLVPDGAALQAELYVPSRSIGFIAEGQPVALRLQAFAHRRFGSARGEVRSIARAPEPPGDTAPAQPLAEPTYRVIVALERQSMSVEGRDVALRPGMLLDANIALERRRLVDWLFEPPRNGRGGA